jgi:NAD(P)H-hydrate repair Nnr-like enzyme with NAD(P)H-hydrate epimerase domain
MALREIVAELGFKIDTKPLEQAKTGLGKIAAQWQVFVGVIAAGAGVLRIGTFIQSMAQAGDQTARLGESLGVSARQVGQWQDTIGRAGGEAAKFGESYKTFAKYLRDAAKGGEDQRKAFHELGVQLRDERGQLRDTSAVYEEFVLGLGQVENAARRAALADDAFGEAGLTLVRVGLAGKDALDKQRASFDALYGSGFERYIKRSQEQVEASSELSAVWTALKRRVAEALLPSFTWLTQTAARVVAWFTRLTRGTKILETGLLILKVALGALGAVLLTAFAPALIFFGKIAAIIAVVVLVVEDLWQMFTGGKSSIAGAIDALFGVGTAKAVVDSVTSAVETLWGWTKSLGSGLLGLGGELQRFGEAVGEVVYDLVNQTDVVLAEISAVFAGLWDGLKSAWDAVLGGLESALNRVLVLVDRVLGPVRQLYAEASDLLGLGDEPAALARGAAVRPSDAPALARDVRVRFAPRELPAGARPGIGRPTLPGARVAPAQVRVQQPVNVTVNGAGDPLAVGDAVRRVIEEHGRSSLEFARDVMLGIP